MSERPKRSGWGGRREGSGKPRLPGTPPGSKSVRMTVILPVSVSEQLSDASGNVRGVKLQLIREAVTLYLGTKDLLDALYQRLDSETDEQSDSKRVEAVRKALEAALRNGK